MGKPKRLLFLISRFLDGGIDTVLIEYLRALSANEDLQVTLAIGLDLGDLEVYKKRIPDRVVVHHLVNTPWLTRWKQQKIKKTLSTIPKLSDEVFLTPFRRFIVKRKLRALAAQHDAVIDFDCCFYGYMKQLPIRKIAYFHFSLEQLIKQNARRMQRIEKNLVYYDKIVTISRAMYEEGKKLLPAAVSAKLCMIYNAIDVEDVREKAMQLPEDDRMKVPYLLAVERLEESQKDISTLLEAYQLLRTKYGRTEKLYLIGKGSSQRLLEEKVKELGLAGNVCFLGFITNPYPWIKQSALLMHSAKFEGLPTILIEALALRKLIVATDCPTGPGEILGGGKAGILVPVGDAERMAQETNLVLTDGSLRQHLYAGISQQMELFTFKHTLKQFYELLN